MKSFISYIQESGRTPEEEARLQRNVEISDKIRAAKPGIEAAGEAARRKGKNIGKGRRKGLRDFLGIDLPQDPPTSVNEGNADAQYEALLRREMQIEADIQKASSPSRIVALRKQLMDIRRQIAKMMRSEEAPYTPRNDYEGEMAISQLNNIARKAETVAKMLKPGSKMEAWVQSKITLADDYITTIHDYLQNTPGSVEEAMSPTMRRVAGALAGLATLAGAGLGVKKLTTSPADKARESQMDLVNAARQRHQELADKIMKREAERRAEMAQRIRGR